MPVGTIAEPPPHPTPLIWLAAGLITLEAATALAVLTGVLLAGLPSTSCGAGFLFSAIGTLILWTLAWPAIGLVLFVGTKLLALRIWAAYLAYGIEGVLLLAAFKLGAIPGSLRLLVGVVSVITISLLAASHKRLTEAPDLTSGQERDLEAGVNFAASSEGMLVDAPSRYGGDDAPGCAAFGCGIWLLGLWEAFGILLLRNRQVRTIMLVAVGFGVLSNLTLGGRPAPSYTGGLPDRVTQVDMLVQPESRLYYADADLLTSTVTADGCSRDGTATTHLTSPAAFPAIYKWYRQWLTEHNWTSTESSPSMDILVPGVEFSFGRGQREHFMLVVDSPPGTGAVKGRTYFSVTYEIKGA